MLSTLIIITLVIWILSMVAKGVCLYSILLIIPTIMFAARKFGWHAKLGAIIGVELFLLFFSVVWTLLFGHMNWIRLLICLILRVVFWGICIYDDITFVYISEERRRQ